jgi:hypothetical protein
MENFVKSKIISLPYGVRGYRFKPQGKDAYIEWYKIHEHSGGLTGFVDHEASQLSKFLNTQLRSFLTESQPENLYSIPKIGNYTIPDNELPIVYPFEDLLKLTGTPPPGFNFEVLGLNRFLIS